MKSPVSILFDINGIPTAVSASAQPTSGALGHVMAGFDATNSVRYARFDGGSLKVTGSVGITGASKTTPVYITGSVGISGAEQFSTEATLSTINAKVPSLGQATGANSVPVVIASDQTVTASLDNGVVSTSNSTTAALAGNATYTGTWEEATNYASISLLVNTDQIGTLFVDTSTNATDVDRTIQLSSGASIPAGIHALIPVGRYYRIRLVNGTSAQSFLRLQTILNKTARATVPVSRNASPLTDYTDVLNTRSSIVGKYNATPPTLTDGDRSDIQLDGNGRLVITLTPAVRDVSTAALGAGSTYTTQTFDTINGQVGLNISAFSTTDMGIFFDESSDGTNWAVINTAQLVAGLGKNESHIVAARYVRVRYVNGTVSNAGGIANLFLATSITTFGTDTNVNIADEFGNTVGADKLFGLRVKVPNDTDTFGAAVSHSRISQLRANFSIALANNTVDTTTSGGGTATVSNGSLSLSTSAATTAAASATTNSVLSYTPGREAYAMFTAAFTTPTNANSTQRIGLFDANNGFFIGFEGTSFGVTVRKGGSDTTVTQSSFNIDTLTGNTNSDFTRNFVPEAIDFTKKNVFRIRFGWLGSAPIRFEVLSPDGRWLTFHTVRQPNTVVDPSIYNTALPITAAVTKTSSNTTDLVMSTSSWDAGVVDVPGIDFTVAGTITALNGAVVTNTSGKGTTSINITGTWSGTLTFEAHNGDANWAVVNAYTTALSPITTTTINRFVFVVSSAYSQVRVRASAWTSGTANVQIFATSPVQDALILPAGAATSANQTTLGSQTTKINDGTNTAAVKAASTPAAVTDPALVVALSPNNTPFEFNSGERLKVAIDSLALFDTFDGSAVNALVWTQSQTGMTQTVANGVITLNAGSSVTSGNFSILTSNKSVRYTENNSLSLHFKARITSFTNTVKEIGWGTVAGVTAPTNGVFIRVNSAGAILGVINAGGTETTTTLVAAGYNQANYLDFNIRIIDTRVTFSVATSDGTTINVNTTVNLPTTTASVVTLASQPLFLRVYNSGTAATAAQILCTDIAISSLDNGPPFADFALVTSVATSTASAILLEANPNRRAVVIFNDASQNLFVKYGATASNTSFTYRVSANGTLELPTLTPDGKPWVGRIDAILASGTGNARITEVM